MRADAVPRAVKLNELRPIHVAGAGAGPAGGDKEAGLQPVALENGQRELVVRAVTIVEGHLRQEPGTGLVVPPGEELDLLLEQARLRNVGVGAGLAAELVVEEVESGRPGLGSGVGHGGSVVRWSGTIVTNVPRRPPGTDARSATGQW